MKNTRVLRRTRRAGLTLIELIVVLAILVALGGIAVAVAPDLIKRTHSAEHVTNAQVVETAVRTNTLLSNGSIGTGYDSLIDSGSAIWGGVPGAALYTPYALTADDVTALQALGLQNVFNSNTTFTAGTTNATFQYSDYAASTAVATGANVCSMPAATAQTLFNVPAPAIASQYLVLGVGPACSLVGANGTMAEAPVHFGENEGARANNSYGRYVIVVELQEAGTANAEARLLGTAVLHDDGPARANDALAEWYE